MNTNLPKWRWSHREDDSAILVTDLRFARVVHNGFDFTWTISTHQNEKERKAGRVSFYLKEGRASSHDEAREQVEAYLEKEDTLFPH
jgi:hypothetical protein